MIREVHVYGQSLEIGAQETGRAQHLGLGKQLIEYAATLAQIHGYRKLAVISAIGTREYYRKRGFTDGVLYQSRDLITNPPMV
jgi:elongator complex protein 3